MHSDDPRSPRGTSRTPRSAARPRRPRSRSRCPGYHRQNDSYSRRTHRASALMFWADDIISAPTRRCSCSAASGALVCARAKPSKRLSSAVRLFRVPGTRLCLCRTGTQRRGEPRPGRGAPTRRGRSPPASALRMAGGIKQGQRLLRVRTGAGCGPTARCCGVGGGTESAVGRNRRKRRRLRIPRPGRMPAGAVSPQNVVPAVARPGVLARLAASRSRQQSRRRKPQVRSLVPHLPGPARPGASTRKRRRCLPGVLTDQKLRRCLVPALPLRDCGRGTAWGLLRLPGLRCTLRIRPRTACCPCRRSRHLRDGRNPRDGRLGGRAPRSLPGYKPQWSKCRGPQSRPANHSE